jgi:hypothetical protein
VNSYTTSDQRYPRAASNSIGNFVVVWQSMNQDGFNLGVFAQRFDNVGAPLGTEFRVNTYIQSGQRYPSVASDSVGNFVVVWDSFAQDNSSDGIFAQRYGSTGAPVGAEFRVNTYVLDVQTNPSIASDPAGNIVVVWQSLTQDGSSDAVIGRRYGSTGASRGVEFRVNTYTTLGQRVPSVASDSAGNFVVTWQSSTQDNGTFGIYAQRYDSAGAPIGTEFRVNGTTTDGQFSPAVARSSDGTFMIVWASTAQDGSSNGSFGQRYTSAGAPIGTEVRVNSYTTDDQGQPFVAIGSAGNFVVVWGSDTQDGSQYGVFGQRYCATLVSVTVAVNGATTVCSGGTGGTVTVTDSGGGVSGHQWFLRALPGGMYVPIVGQLGAQYVILGSDFPGLGLFAVVCQTTPACGSQTTSAENVQVTVTMSEGVPPSVTAPGGQTVTQTLCQ